MNLDESFDADEILREPDTFFDEETENDGEETTEELNFHNNSSLENFDVEELDDPYL